MPGATLRRSGCLQSRRRSREVEAFREVLALRSARFGLAASIALSAACADLTRPPPSRVRRADAESVPAAAAAPSDAAGPGSPAAAPAAPEPDQIGASHILVAYQGATRARPTVTRTRDEAKQLAEQLSAKAHAPGADFARLARESSDAPTGIEGGALPKFRRQQMVKPFSDAAFALKPGEISDVVETNFGFHIIKRTE
jgi:parvulin-like peptidyl-prolyl isomerase